MQGSNLAHKALGMQTGSSASPMVESNLPRHSLAATGNGREPVIHHGLNGQQGDYWDHGRLTNSIEHVGGEAAVRSSESALVISDTEHKAQEKIGDQGSYEDFFQSLVESVTPQGGRQERNYASLPDDGRQQSMTSHSSASMLMYDPDDGYKEPEDEQPNWEPNAGDVACFQLDKPMKTAFNMFARSAHDVHRFPAKTRKNVVETYHLFTRQVWNLLLEQDKTAWRSLAAARGCFLPQSCRSKVNTFSNRRDSFRSFCRMLSLLSRRHEVFPLPGLDGRRKRTQLSARRASLATLQ